LCSGVEPLLLSLEAKKATKNRNLQDLTTEGVKIKAADEGVGNPE
jgi:hypothetical protein